MTTNICRQNSEPEKSRRRISSYQQSMVPLIIVKESNEQSEDVEHCKDLSCNDKLEQKPVIIEEVETDQLIRNVSLINDNNENF